MSSAGPPHIVRLEFRAEGPIRLCYAADRTVLEPALERLGRFLEAW